MSTVRNSFVIDTIPGDGIGAEVVPAAMRCVDAVSARCGLRVTWRVREWGSAHYRATGRMMPADGIDQLRSADAIFLGAVGDPDIPDDVTLWGLLIPIRREFDQYANVRPARSLPGVSSKVADDGIDLVVVRENVEGEYSEIGGRFHRGKPDEFATQQAIFTRSGVARVAGYAARLAAARRGRLISATKSNGIIHTMPFWDEVVQEVVATVAGVELERVLVDALAARMVLAPKGIDVIVGSNLFGDILSDLAAAITGSLGIAPSANLNPERRYPSLFEPVHGSAPDIAGSGVANPVAAIWAAAMMLDHLGAGEAAALLQQAFSDVLAAGTRTRDLGGGAGTAEFTDAVLDRLGA
jgi:tartrate dehydrogenase/decarboxylase/D-malate dehydrogenase